jgi:hypothetical protein
MQVETDGRVNMQPGRGLPAKNPEKGRLPNPMVAPVVAFYAPVNMLHAPRKFKVVVYFPIYFRKQLKLLGFIVIGNSIPIKCINILQPFKTQVGRPPDFISGI